MNFLVSPGKMQFHFLENKIFFLWLQNARWFFSKHTWKHDMMFSVYSVKMVTAWKVSKYGVFSDPYCPVFGVNLCIRSECRKTRTRKNSVFGHFSRSGHFFPYKHEIILLSKKQRWSTPKNTPKDDISGITAKDNAQPRKDDIDILG